MAKFSEKSFQKLDTCSPLLREVAKEAIEVVDFSVLWGHRPKNEQNRLVEEGYSTLVWPRSKHNSWPSHAFDLAPWPIDWEDRERFFYLAGVIMGIARSYNTRVRWGGAWDGSLNREGQLDDLGHFELE